MNPIPKNVLGCFHRMGTHSKFEFMTFNVTVKSREQMRYSLKIHPKVSWRIS